MKRSKNSQIPFREHIVASLIFILRHPFPQNRWLELQRKKNCHRIIKALQKKLKKENLNSGEILEVERHENLTENEFISGYLNKGIPVIFNKGSQHWGCTQKWNLDYLKDTYGDEEFSQIDSTGLVESEFNKAIGKSEPVLVKKISAKNFVLSIRAGGKNYLRGCPILETRPELLNDLDLHWLKKMRRCFLGVSFQTFVGSPGRTTPMHSETTSFFFILADGEKKWVMYNTQSFPLLNPSPEGRGYFFSKVKTNTENPAEFPGMNLLTRYVCHLKKGDILFVPAWMWHEVENLTESWGVSYRFTSLRGFLRHPTFVFIRVFLARPSFIETLYYSFFRSDISKRKKNLLTPKIYFKD